MTFDKSKVYTVLNADEVKAGSKGYFADSINVLRKLVEKNANLEVLRKVDEEDSPYRFVKDGTQYALFYLVEEPQEEKYRPYESTDEMIEDYKERIKAYGAVPFRCPMFMQNIWIMEGGVSKHLITDFSKIIVNTSRNTISLEDLFNGFTYLDGTPCGKKI